MVETKNERSTSRAAADEQIYAVCGDAAVIPVGVEGPDGTASVQFITVHKGFMFKALADAGGVSGADRLKHLIDVNVVKKLDRPEDAPTQSQSEAPPQ